ncbi:MAG: mandelate racemase/muconate lactonizing enzyme family protein, partial [Geminicoccaceae bacterium]
GSMQGGDVLIAFDGSDEETFEMRIKSAEVIPLRLPFTDGGAGTGLMPTKWTHLDVVLLRLETDDGLVGWGDGFAYVCRTAIVAALEDMVLPLVVGQSIDDVADFNRELQQKLHLHGRYGITTFAISAVDIALWDIAGKRDGKPLADLLGGRRQSELPAYASLVRYGDPELVRAFAEKAVGDGFETVKLHEITREAIEAGRAGVGEGIRLTTDVNCNWSTAEAEDLMPTMKELDLYWVEEPIFPPDDAEALGKLQRDHGVAIASGENACTAVEFARTVPEIAFVQPSITKVGGVTEFLAVCELAETHGKAVMPHAPYFGPGYWATVQAMAARPVAEFLECLYIDPEAWLDPAIPLPNGGKVSVLDRPGLGFEPDPRLLARYAA